MNRFRLFLAVFFASLALLGRLDATVAAITWTGSISPADPNAWTSSTLGYVGETANGTLAVSGGSDLLSDRVSIASAHSTVGQVTVNGTGSTWTNGGYLNVGRYGNGTLNITNGGFVRSDWNYIGSEFGSIGSVTVTGAGSTWTSNGLVCVGFQGRGTLNISNGGSVAVAGTTRVAHLESSTGTIDFGSGGGTLTTQSLWASPSHLTGTGTISTRGLVSDVSLVFDASHDLWQTLKFGGITLNLDLNDPVGVGDLGAGYRGTGSLLIQDGVAVQSKLGQIGARPDSVGTATVRGAGSNWTTSSDLGVGVMGHGRLTVTDGGAVSCFNGYVAFDNDATGVATVEGVGSKWIIRRALSLGSWQLGTLTITEGGLVSVGTTLTTDKAGIINMATGGMLALYGDADDSLGEFLNLAKRTDAIRYWNAALDDWAPITAATPGVDYTLAYIDDVGGSLHGYTLLTVGVIPEPGTLAMVFLGAFAMLMRRYR
ncbi:MAG TPA: hypothetical protein DD670_12510 [Planctomycetaceae bacterium]|nr:hypothetical protein [Planctomycetaceae bacterium]